MSDSGAKQVQKGDYFIPNLCHGQGLLGLFVMAALLALLLALVHSGIADFDFIWLGKAALLIFWIALLSALLLCSARDYLIDLPLPRAALANYLLVLLAATLCAVVAEYWRQYSAAGQWRADLFAILDIVLIAAIPAGVILRLYYLQQRLHQQQSAGLEARLQALQAKIRPHFLFNSMNSLATLIHIDADRAEKIVENLSDLFRYALQNSSDVSLREEVDACQRYLEIEKMRLDERLEYSWDIKLDINAIRVPALILQPLIENAVFHGIQPAVDGGAVYITIFNDEKPGWITIDLVNSLPEVLANRDTADRNTAATSGHQMALENLRCRLDTFFNGLAELDEAVIHNHYHTRIRFKPLEG
jgi:two-component system sensor histidine kinase AlgZ